MKKIETLFFDESGTPAVSLEEGLFVVGGFSIRGDINRIFQKWLQFLRDNNLTGKKGKKYKKDDFLNLSDFMCRNKIIPVTSHSRLNKDDLAILHSKIRVHNEIAFKTKQNHMYINPDEYIWIMQVAVTVASSILSIIINRGLISEVKIAVDEYLKKERLQNYVNDVLENSFSDKGINKIFKPIYEKYKTQPNVQNFLKNFKPKGLFISLDWNLRGKLALLADSVCSLYRRMIRGKSEISPAWHVLKLCFKTDGVTPLCIGNDLTSLMKRIIREPWILEG